jgi:hypothetical protein
MSEPNYLKNIKNDKPELEGIELADKAGETRNSR